MYYNGNPVTVYGSVVATPGDAVLFTEQTLTDSQKNQARSNIGATSQSEVDYLHGRLPSGELVFPDTKTGDTHTVYAEKGKLILKSQGEQNKSARVLTDEDSLFLVELELTDAQKAQARENIGAAFGKGKLIVIPERRNEEDAYGVGVENGKMYLQKYDKETGTFTGSKDRYLTSSDVSGIVEDVIAALPIYSGEVEEV